jgi:hypothetical protein
MRKNEYEKFIVKIEKTVITGQWSTGVIGDHNGEEIKWNELPLYIQIFVLENLFPRDTCNINWPSFFTDKGVILSENYSDTQNKIVEELLKDKVLIKLDVYSGNEFIKTYIKGVYYK